MALLHAIIALGFRPSLRLHALLSPAAAAARFYGGDDDPREQLMTMIAYGAQQVSIPLKYAGLDL